MQQQFHKKKATLDLRPSKLELDEKKSQQEFILLGHSGPVYGLSISVDDKMLLSCSYDTTSKSALDSLVRLWSLQQKSLLGVFHGHSFPVWRVQFSPLGYYFASCSNDRTAKLWQIKQHVPIR